MLSAELLQKVRQIEISTHRWVDEALTGQYKSQFKGHGVTFSEHREYIPGDDVRHIDWRVSARSRDLLIRKYEEERELVVFMVLDLSGSAGFGSRAKLKSDVIAEIGGLLGFVAQRTGDKMGSLVFDGAVEGTLPPRKGKMQVFRLLKQILEFRPKRPGTAMAEALRATDRVMKQRGIVFILSDFLAEGYELELRRLAMRHDIVLIDVYDPAEHVLPESGEVRIEDPETGQEVWLDLGSPRFRREWKLSVQQMESRKAELLKRLPVDVVRISSTEDYAKAVVAFFRKRARSRGTRRGR